MLRYEQFQEIIFNEVGSQAAIWKHLLPAIPIAHRNRFLSTIQKGFAMPDSFDMVMLSQKMGDVDFDSFVMQAVANKLTGEKEKGDIEQSR